MHLLFRFFSLRFIDIISCINLACYLHYICLTGELCDWSIDTELIEMTKWLRENVLYEVKCVCILRDIESRTWFVEKMQKIFQCICIRLSSVSTFSSIFIQEEWFFSFFSHENWIECVYTRCARCVEQAQN